MESELRIYLHIYTALITIGFVLMISGVWEPKLFKEPTLYEKIDKRSQQFFIDFMAEQKALARIDDGK